MLKVLLVDDEVIICQMLKKLINWQEKGLEVCGMAHSGTQAIEMFETFMPDIVISDVRMPGIDGLQFVKECKRRNSETDFIIMSGYKQFEYAYTALNLGVLYYLLKPINKQELEETLERILRSRQERLSEEEEHKKLEQIAKEGNERIRKHFLSDIMLEDGLTVSREASLQEPEFGFEKDCFLAFLTKIDQTMIKADYSHLLGALDYLIEKSMQAGQWEYINSYIKSGVVTVVNYVAEQRDAVRQTIEDIMLQSRYEMNKFQGFYVVIGVGSEQHSLKDVRISIKSAIDAVKCRLKLGTDKIIWSEELEFETVDLDEILDEKNRMTLNKEIESLDKTAFAYHVEKLADNIRRKDNYSPILMFELLDKITEICFKRFRMNQVSETLLNEAEQKLPFVYDSGYRERMLIYQYQEVLKKLFADIMEENANKSQRPIRIAEKYIQEHSSRSITLEEVAEITNLSTAYLSTLFKKEKGIRFSDYVIQCKMEMAKTMLKETDLPINLIAEKTGYTDSRYFSKTFAKTVGLKPTEYRKLYS